MTPIPKKSGIVQVAKLARVSPMTVTRTLNNSAPVAEATRKRVLEAASKLGYTPDPFARALRGCKTKSIGILWGLCGPHSSTGIIREMAWLLHQRGYFTYINDNFGDKETIIRTLSEYVERRVDGLIFSARHQHILKDNEITGLLRNIPAVVVESPEDHNWKCDKLILDYYKSVEDIADHFVKTGKKRPVVITDYISLLSRIEVFRKRLEYHGIMGDCFIQRSPPDAYQVGDSFVKGLLSKYPEGKYPFDAVWASCDEGAAALINHFEKSGYRVPEDIAVVGFNNNETSQYMTPPLASVERMNDKVMSSIIRMLLNRIENPGSDLAKETIHMEFIPRKSAGKKGVSR